MDDFCGLKVGLKGEKHVCGGQIIVGCHRGRVGASLVARPFWLVLPC
jgi:hypothetical protein